MIVTEETIIIPIWKAQDKFDNPSRAIYGERLKIILRKPDNRRNHQLVFIREFKNYFDFLEERRRLMAQKIEKYYKSL